MERRPRLTRDLVVSAAAAVADRGGLAAVSMRSTGRELGVEAMSLYHHVASKDALVDALADWVFEHFAPPTPGEPWRAEMAARARSARSVLVRHPWGLGLIESRDPGPALLRHHDAVLGTLLAGGFPIRLAAHAFSAIDAYVYGFALTEATLPLEPADGATQAYAAEMAPRTAGLPHLTRLLDEVVLHPGYAFADEFDYGLELILDGLEQRLRDR